jgi:IPT/TIG domain
MRWPSQWKSKVWPWNWAPTKWKVWKGWPGSKPVVFFVQMAYLFGLGLFVILYRVHTIEPRSDFFGPVPFLVPWFGAVGAVMLSLQGVFDHRDDWNRKYGYWHWARPFIGGVVATVGVLILQSGILAVGGELPSASGTQTAKNLLYFIVAFIVGFREDVFRSLIQRVADVLIKPADAAPKPVIASVTPPTAAGGTQTDVTLIGSGFAGATSVKLGSDSIPFICQSDTKVIATIPTSAQQAKSSLIVTTANGATSVPFEVT